MPDITFDHLKILGQSQRLAILRCLMARPATLSQLGAYFHVTPAHIRHHVQVLAEAGLIEPAPGHPQHNHLEKYYRAATGAWSINLAVLPAPDDAQVAIVLGSKDRAVHALADYFNAQSLGFALQVLPLNSLDGLVALRQGVCQMATCHLLDEVSGEYNRSFVRHLFLGQAMAILQLYWREEGLIVQPGNPRGVRGLEDLAERRVKFINREPGSGVRLWLDMQLKDLGIDPACVDGYQTVADSHATVAQAVRQGRAEAGIGLVASAREAGLDFIPLFTEPYELVLRQSILEERRYAPFFDHLNSREFRTVLRDLDGYRIPQTAGQADAIPG
jgi:molybdate-binding protein